MTVLALAVARLRRRPGRGLLTALGVALAAAALVATLAIRTLAGDLALRQAITVLPVGDRSATVSRSQATEDLPGLDRTARAALARLGTARVRSEIMLRVLSDGKGGTFRLAAVEDAPSAVRLTSGRLPQPCSGGTCEVLLIGTAEPDLDPELGIEVVGRAALTDPVVLAGTFDPGPETPILLTSDLEGLQAHEPVILIQRSYGWVAPLDATSLRVAGLGELLRTTAAAASDAERSGMVLTAPDDALVGAADRAQASSRRLLLVGGQLVAVLAAFVALAALGLRDDHGTALRLLARRGASRRQSFAFTAAEAGWPVLAGLVPGVAVGIATALAVADHEGVDGGRLVRDALGGDALLALLVLVATLWILLAAVLRTSEGPLRKGIRATDIAAVVLAAVALLAASRGNATAARLGEQGDPLLALLPALVAGAGGLAAMRLVGPALAGIARIAPARFGLARVGVADALRRPARPLATVAFLVAACALAIFATAYRSTLRTGAADQAAFAVPLDARLVSGPSLALPLDLATLDDFRALAGDGYATPVVRRSAVVRTAGTAPDPGADRRAAARRADPHRAVPERPIGGDAGGGARARRLPGRRRSAAARGDRAAPRCDRHRHLRRLRHPGPEGRRPGRRHGARADPRAVPRRPVRRPADPRVAERHLGDPAPHRRGRDRGREAPGRDRPEGGRGRAGRPDRARSPELGGEGRDDRPAGRDAPDPQRPRRRLGDRPRRPAHRRAHAAGDRRPGHGGGRPGRHRRHRRRRRDRPARPGGRHAAAVPDRGHALHRDGRRGAAADARREPARPRARPARSGSAATAPSPPPCGKRRTTAWS